MRLAQSVAFGALLASSLLGQTSVSVVGVTSTQSILRYTCGNSSAATIEVSESPTYSPLVHDVNSTLFSGAGSDGSSVVGVRPDFVVGKRETDLALDTNYYSRSLQAYTTHYYRITGCGATATGTFTTGNILMSSSYLDFVQLDKSSAGNYIRPTLLTSDRNQVIIDPYTGVKMTRVSLIADSVSDGGGGTGPFLNFGGFVRATGRPLVNSGTGYLNVFPQGNGGFSELFFINASTHAATYLGKTANNPVINETDGLMYAYDQGTDTLIQSTYTGTFAAATSGTAISVSNVNILTSVTTAMQAFNANCSATLFTSSTAFLDQAQDDFLYFIARRSSQDTYGCIAVVRISTGLVIAATRVDLDAPCRWCAIHNSIANGASGSLFIGVHSLVANVLGGGPYITTYVSGGTMPGSATTITISGEPACAGCGADTGVPTAQVGDVFKWSDGNNEDVKILQKFSPTSWQISSTASAHSPGATLTAECNNGILFPTSGSTFPVAYWNFLSDSSGASLVQNTTWPVGGHDDGSTYAPDHTKDLRITEDNGWVGRTGDMITNLANGTNFSRSANNFFAGAEGHCDGDGCRRHPSVGPNGVNWGTDLQIWDQVPFDATLTNVSGSLYKYNPGSFTINTRYLPLASRIGHPGGNPALWKSLLDISSTSSSLGTGAGDNYKVCQANATNECHTGSAKGDIFVNVPGSPNNCGGAGQNPNADAPCLANYNSWSSQIVQWGTDGVNARGLGGAVFAVMDTLDTPSAKTLPDGNGILFAVGNYQNNTPSQMMLAKTTPFTAPDAVDRTKFIPISVSLVSPGGGAVTGGVKFGYLENGTTSQYYCTTRAEACVATSTSAPPTNGTTDPFRYITSDVTNGSWNGAGCTLPCTVIMPVAPGHIVYYQPVFMDSGNTIISTGTAAISGDFVPQGPATSPAVYTPIGISQIGIDGLNTGTQIDYHAIASNPGTPTGDTYYFTGWANSRLLAAYPSSWPDNTGLPIIGTWNDGATTSPDPVCAVGIWGCFN